MRVANSESVQHHAGFRLSHSITLNRYVRARRYSYWPCITDHVQYDLSLGLKKALSLIRVER